MSCCLQRVDGAAVPVPVPPELLCGTPICINEDTVAGETITIPIGTLGAAGAALTFLVRLEGEQTNGERGLYFAPEGNAARNAAGSGLATPILIGPVGYTDTILVPWTTLGVPAGWGAGIAVVANVLQLTFNAAIGQPANWRGIIYRWAHNGAVLA